MRFIQLLCLASAAGAFQKPLLVTDSCSWQPLEAQVTCRLNDNTAPPASSHLHKEAPASKVKLPSPSKWEATGKCSGTYCIFKNLGFANGRGMVAITTTQNIKKLKALEKF